MRPVPLPDTILSRAALILIGALLALHVLGYWAYNTGAELLASSARDRALSERIISIKKAVDQISGDENRDRTAHNLSSTTLEVHWSRSSLVLGNAAPTERALAFERRLKDLAPGFAAEAFRVGYEDDGILADKTDASYRHMLLVSIRLTDGSWLNFSTPSFGSGHWLGASMPLLALCLGLAIIVIAVLLLRWATQPLQRLADAADALNLDRPHAPLLEDGPAEVRRAAQAFNAMESRIRRLIRDRTQALAAVSHDLRTPLTRLRLRAEMLEDDDTRAKIADDVGEMEQMIGATLEYLKLGASTEDFRKIDLASLLQTVISSYDETGRTVAYRGPATLPVRGQVGALRRAINNLIDNGLKYGNKVSVTLCSDGHQAIIGVADDGHGIPESEYERVFEPFYRIEDSRNSKTGGTGLGLTIARDIVLAHGGKIELRRALDVFVVSIMLPCDNYRN